LSGALGVIHVLAQRNLQVGGPAYSVPRLSDSLADQDVAVQLWSIDAPDLGAVAELQHARSMLWPASTLARRMRGFAPGFARALRLAASDPAIALVHNHGLWMFPNRDARRAAVAARKPLVCSPRGMLEAWSLQRSIWSKRLAWWAFERRNLQAVGMFHATSEAEAQSIRDLGYAQPIAIIANGIDELPLPDPTERAAARSRMGLAEGQRMLLFMSRLHEKKGLVPLLHAWKALGGQTANWKLVLAGSDLDGYAAVVRDTVIELRLEHAVQLPGMLLGREKADALAAADAFVLPSHSENFGIAVAEAAMAGLPVLTTHGTPWQALVKAGGGWQVQANTSDLTSALAEIMLATPADLLRIGGLARHFVQQHHGWSSIAAQMAASYRWLLGLGERPDCVRIH
jgi:glycosyltransferase involved in cell wall biosynthesis